MRSVGLVVLWLVACAAAIGVAWAGVSVVDAELVNPAPAQLGSLAAAPPGSYTDLTPLGAEGLEASTAAPRSSSVAPATLASTTTALPVVPTTATTLLPTPSTPRSVTTTTTTTTQPAPSTTTTSESTTTVATTAPPPATQTVTYSLIGGVTAISFAPDNATVLWATPNPGFTVEVDNGGSSVQVEFRADQHRSRIDAEWSDGPDAEIREDAR